MNEGYHSTHGALAESMHIFIQAGFREIRANPVHILEIGFGTGLNAFLTLCEAQNVQKQVFYETIEAFPIAKEIYEKLNYPQLISHSSSENFQKLHELPWNQWDRIDTDFSFRKWHTKIEEFEFAQNQFDIVYFDAFAPQFQPELWSVGVFEEMHKALKPNGILVTYCCKGEVKRDLKSVGFTIEKLPGPKGKREILRAWKNE